jgi:tRNA (guanine-N7-)-methyltransferase
LRIHLPRSDGPLDPRAFFAEPLDDIWLEVGFGSGEHLAAQALAHPRIGMIGCEPFANGVAGLLAKIDAEGIDNIRILDDDARLLFDVLPDACLGRVFALFSDPWPKKRHAKRRFFGAASLDVLARLMSDGAELRFASDDMGYVRWSLEQIVRHPDFAWPVRAPRDWREPPADWFSTRYEAKALRDGRPCVYLRFLRRHR